MIHVLIVDDSSFMRKSLTHILHSDKFIKVVGTAADGEEGLRKVKQLRPDVILLDIGMPVMDGFATLEQILRECPTPVLMVSGLNEKDPTLAMKSLQCGAVDFIPKPSGVISYDIDKLSNKIITKVKVAASSRVSKSEIRPPKTELNSGMSVQGGGLVARKKMVVIGASTGGSHAVTEVLSDLPKDISVAVIVVQHLDPEFVPLFVDRLRWRCALEVSVPQRDEVIRPGRVFVAPGRCPLIITPDGAVNKIRFGYEAPPGNVFPSIDDTMESVARAYGEGALGVLLTGMGSDGARGLKAIKEAGGGTIVEDPSTCAVFGMPKAAIALGCVDEIVPLPQIAKAILRKI